MSDHDRIAFLKGVPGERALVVRLQAGEPAAFRECYETHGPPVLHFLVGFLRDRSLAEDVLHDTFELAFNRVGGFRSEARLRTWLTGIAVRQAVSARRSDARRLRHAEPPPRATDPEPWLDGRDAARRTLALLEELDEPKRVALLLQAQGWTAAEIAEMQGEPRGTVLSRLARGRAELLELAEARGLDSPAAREGGR